MFYVRAHLAIDELYNINYVPVATPVCVWQAFTTLAAFAIMSSETKLGRVCNEFI